MTRQTSHFGLIILSLAIGLGLCVSAASAQERPRPTREREAQPQVPVSPEEAPASQEAMRKLEEIRERMQAEAQEAGETVPPAAAQEPGAAGPTSRPTPETGPGTVEAQPAGDVPDDFVGPPVRLARVRPAPTETTRPAEDEPPGVAAAEPGVTPAELPERRPRTDEDEEWFNFVQTPWEDVVAYFVERIGKPLMGDETSIVIGGELTYVSDRKFTKDEALDELNLIMYEKGYRFVEEQHHVRIVPLVDLPQYIPLTKTFDSIEAFNAADPRDMDYVVVYYRVKDLPAQTLVDMFSYALPIDAMLTANDDTNQIKIMALARDVRKFLALKEKIDITPQDPRELRFFEIKTNARQIEQLVRNFLNIGGGRSGTTQFVRDPRTGRMVPQRAAPQASGQNDVQIVADERTNSLIVKATKDKMREIEELIKQFDQEPPIGNFETRVVKVQHVDASEAANLLNQVFQQEQGQSQSSTPDWQRQRAVALARARALAAQRARQRGQQPQQPQPDQAQAITTGDVSPEDIIAEGIFERAKKTVRITADARQNRLFVYANEEGHARVLAMLNDIDQPKPTNFHIIEVQNATVGEIAPLVTELASNITEGGRPAQIVPDATKNVFYVLADESALTRIKELVQQLDAGAPELERYVVRLQNLRPSDVANMVRTLLESGTTTPSSTATSIRRRLPRGRTPTPSAGVTASPTYQIIPLDDAQLLLVYCAPEEWEKVEETIKLWDDNALTNSPQLETFKIERGNIDTIANTLGMLYRSYQHPAFGHSSVYIGVEGDQLLVYGIRPAIEEIRALIATLDVESTTDKVEILPLAYADASQVAQQLQTMYGGGRRTMRPGGGAGGTLIQAEPITNSLIVQAGKTDLEAIKDFAMRMDQQVAAQAPERKFFTLKYADPREVTSAVSQLYAGGVGGRFRGQPVGQQVKVVVSGPQVIVEAPAEKMAEIEAFIAQLDDPKGNEIIIKTVKLPGSDVGQIASKLNNAFRARPNVIARFDPDATAETILLTCSRDAQEEAERLITEYADAQRGQEMVVEFRQMNYAQASDAANWLREQLVTYLQTQLGRNAVQLIKVTADARTNRVIINAPQVAVTLGKQLLDQFDVEPGGPPISVMETEARKLPGLDVRALANNLNQAFRGYPARPDRLQASFASDETTETLLISAPKDMYEKINELIAKFEAETLELAPEQKFIAITEADANYIANQVRSILQVQIGRTRGRGVVDRISLTVDTRRNEIIINAPKFVIPIAEELIARLDQPQVESSQLQTITLVNADAGTVHGVLNQIFGEKIRARTLQISVEPLTNSLIVGGSKADYEEIERWAKDLDEQSVIKGTELQIVDTVNANPWEIVNILNAQYGARKWGQKNRVGQDFTFYVVGGRSIAVQAPKDKLEDIRALIAQLDEVGAVKVEVRTYELPGIGDQLNTLANQVATAVNQKITGREQRINVTTYGPADAMIVTALPDQFIEVEAMIEKFRPLVEGQVSITDFIELQYVNAEQVAGMVQQMVANRVAQNRGRRAMQNFSIQADPRTNRLIVWAPDTVMADVREVVAKLDVEAPDPGRIRAIALASADATAVAGTLNQLFVQGKQASRSRSEIQTRIQAEPITNSLLVVAADEDYARIEAMALDIDEKSVLQGNAPSIITLKYANPNEVANLVNQWFGGRRGRGASQATQAQASVVNGTLVVSAPKKQFDEITTLVTELDQPDASGIEIKTYTLRVLNASQVQGQVQAFLASMGQNVRAGQLKPGAFAEPTTNTLVVMAPREMFTVIDNLISQLEGLQPERGETQAYVLTNVRAEQIAQNVDAMLKAKIAEREGNVRKSVVQTSVFAEQASNRLFVFAPQEYQELAAKLIEMVDADVASKDIVHIITLTEGDAQQLAQTLTQIIQGSRQGSGSPGARSGIATVRVTPDAGSNSIILAGMPKDIAEVERLIKDLEAESTNVPELQIFQLQWASTEDAIKIIENIYGGGRTLQDKVTVTPDEYNNRLYVTANRRKMRLVEGTITQVDQAPPTDEGGLGLGGRDITFFDIARGDAFEIAWDVRDIIGDAPGGPEIESDWFGEYIRVTCRPSELPRIEKLIREFERRAKVERVQRLYDPKGAPRDAMLAYLMQRSEGERVAVERLPSQAVVETLVEDLWPEGSEPPAVEQRKREREKEKERNNAETRPPARRSSRALPYRPGLRLSPGIMDSVIADVCGTPVVRHEPTPAVPPSSSPFRLAAYQPPAEQPAQPPARPPQRPTTATAQPAPPRPAPAAAQPAPAPPVSDTPSGTRIGQSSESPFERESVRIVEQPDGRFLIVGPKSDVEDITGVLDLFLEDTTEGEVIRIFRFKYGDVSAAAEVLNIMFNERQQIVIQQPQQQRRPDGRDDQQQGRDRQQGGFMDQFRGMVGERGTQGQRSAGPRLRIATDPGHNYLIIKCNAVDLPEIRQVLRELDIPPGEVQIEIFQLYNLVASETAENIKAVLGISKVQQRRGGPTGGARAAGGAQQQLMEMLQQQLVSVPGVEGGAKVERVEIVPNEVTNSLLVSSPPEVMSLIREVINDLEALEGFHNVGIYHYELKRAKVDDVLPLLQELFEAAGGGGGGRGTRGGASPSELGPVTISADPRVNTIIFTAEAKDRPKVEAQIQALDLEGPVADAELYICKYGDAGAIASMVETIFAESEGRSRPRGAAESTTNKVRIVADAGTNTILVWGPPEKRDLIFTRIEELDNLSRRDIREIDVQYADPEDLAATLSGIFGGGATAQPARGGDRRGGGAVGSGSGRIMILGDKSARKLLIRAPDEVFAQIQQMVETLDQPSKQMQLRRFQLTFADAELVVESVKAALQEYMTLAKGTGEDVDLDAFTAMPDPRTNSIVVVGTEKTFLFVDQILSAIDVQTPDDQKKEFRVFVLEKADAEVVAEAINGFATGGGAATTGGGGRRGGGAPAGGQRELNVWAIPDAGTNSVMVFGRMEDIDLIETAVIQRYEDTLVDQLQIATIPVQNVPPSQVVGFIYQFIDQGAAVTGGGSQRGGRRPERGGLTDQGGPQIVPNDNGKTLIVRGTKRQIDEVRGLVERFDNPDIVSGVIKVIPVPYGQDAAELATMVQQVVNDTEAELADRTGRRPRQVVVQADPYTNAIIAAGEPSLFGQVETILQQLEQVGPKGAVTRVIEFRNLSADDAQEIINDLQQQRGSSGSRRSSSPRPSGTRSRPSGGRRGSLMPGDVPGYGTEPLLKITPAAWLEPVVAATPLSPYVGLLLAGAGADEPAGRMRLVGTADRQAVEEEVLQELERQPRTTQPARPATPPAAPPEEPAEPAAPAIVTDTLTGVTGSLRGEVTAQAVDSRRLVITGSEDDVAFIEEILAMMDARTSPAIIDVFTLKSAKATALAPIIEKAIQAKIDARTTQPGPQDKFSINAEGRSNSLIVSASEVLMAEIELLIDELDVDTGETDVRSVRLDNMRSVEAVSLLKPIIEKLNTQREVPKESQVSISAIERSNSVMIVGTPKDLEEVTALVKEIDVELTKEEEEKAGSFVTADVVLIQLKNGSADDVAKVLTDMIEEQQENARKADPEKPGEPFVKLLRLRLADGQELPPLNLDRPIKVLPEKGTNSLIIFSSKDNNEALQAIVQVFDTLPIGVETDVKVFALRYAAAEDVAKLIEEIFKDKSPLKRPAEGDSTALEKGVLPPVPPGVAARGLPFPLLVQSEARTNSVVVIGRKDAVLLAGGLVSELDRPTLDLGLKAYVLQLKYLTAEETADKLDKMLTDRAKAIGGDQNTARDSAVIAVDARSNSLLVFATEEVYGMIADLVGQLDGMDKYGTVDVRYHGLKFADAVKLQGILKEVFDAKQKAEKETNKESKDSLAVLADTRSNSLLLTGTRDYLAEAERLITEFDQESDGTVVFRALKVRLNSAPNVASLLEDMIEKALKQQDTNLKGTPIHVVADPISDSLILAASREDMEVILRWVEILDRPSEIGRMTLIVPLRRAKADDVSKAVQDVFKKSGGQQAGELDITVTADEKTNSVVAFGPPALLNDIEDFIKQLDGVDPTSGSMVRMFKLTQADAEEAGELLTRILELQGGSVGGGGGGGGGGSSQDKDSQVLLIWQQHNPDVGVETLKAIRKDIQVLSDLRTNSLVVTAPPESMPLMESLVKAIDLPPDAANIRVFQLRNADAEQMVEMLEELFERKTAGTTSGGQDESERVLGGVGGREEIAFTTDVRTNSVIAAGTPGYLDLVEKFVLDLDTKDIPARRTFVYAPKNIPAEALQGSLKEFSDAEQQRLQDIGEEVSIQVRQSRQINAIANEDANRILIDVDPRFEDTVMKVIDELDQPPPQVIIQVLIIEVTMDNELDLGIEFAFQDLQWSKAGPNDTTTFDYVGGTDIGAAGSGLGGFSFTVTGADFNFLFRTLQNEGNLKVLSRPMIVAMDNKEAKIDVSDDVPYVSGTSTTTGGQITTSVSRKPVGIVLTVTPQINPDGFVRMEIKQEVSDFTSSTVDIAPGVTSPVFFNRVAETNLMVKDNETVVLGGLITSRVENREQKVPLLGDIPGLGLLFRNQNDTSRRTELLLVLTPHVVRTVDEYRDLSIRERDTLRLTAHDVLTDPLMQGLQVTPEELPPDVEPLPTIEELEAEQETYGPLRPALRPTPQPATDPNSYDVPLTLRSR